MVGEHSHPADGVLLLYAGGELPRRMEQTASHIAGCHDCQTRLTRLNHALADFATAQRQSCGGRLPSAEKARAALLFRIDEAKGPKHQFFAWSPAWLAWRGYALAAVILIAVSLVAVYRRGMSRTQQLSNSLAVWIEPKFDLTPGATLPITKAQICLASAKSRDSVVPSSLQREVFARYGIASISSNYEVDYLITPELGGATDIRNLWPEPYFDTAWNARVKDQLEQLLHDKVCRGDVDLATAQQDISTDWIAAYRKYFHTDTPLADASLRRL